MARSVSRWVEEAFEGKLSKDYAIDLLQAVREAERDHARAMNRYSLLAFAIMVTFELIVRSTAREPMQFGSFTITDTGLAAALTVAAVAWCYLEGVLAEMSHHDLEIAHCTLMGIAYPPANVTDVHLLALSARPSLYPANYAHEENARLSDRLRYRLRIVLNGAATVGVATFAVHAYIELFRRYGQSDVRLWLSLAGTASLLLAAWTIAVVWLFESPDESPIKRDFTKFISFLFGPALRVRRSGSPDEAEDGKHQL